MTMKRQKTIHRFAAVAAVLLALCLVFVTPVGAAGDLTSAEGAVAKIGDSNYYSSLQYAFDDATDGDTITLLCDVTMPDEDAEGHPYGGDDATSTYHTNPIDFTGITFDLNQKTLSVPKMALIFVGKDITIKNGAFDGCGASYSLWIGDDGFETQNVNVEGVTTSGGINIYNSSDVTLKDVTAVGNDYYAVWADEDVSEVSIISGTYTGASGMSSVLEAEDGSITIIGGTFSTDVSEYLKEGYQVSNVGSTYTVSVITSVANIRNVGYASLQDAVDAAAPGATITLQQRITNPDAIVIDKSITIDGAQNTITQNKKHIFTIFKNGDTSPTSKVTVIFKNLNLVNSYKITSTGDSAGRCINTYVGNIDLTLENCNLKTDGGTGNPQLLTVGGSGNAVSVTLKNTKIDAGNSGYGILTFVPVTLTIQDNSKITGYAALYFKKDSSNSIVKVKGGSELKGENVHSGESNSFATVVFEESNNIQLILSEKASVAFAKTSGESEAIFGFKSGVTDNQIYIGNGVNLELDGEKAVFISGNPNTITIENGVISNFQIAEGLSEDQVCVSNGENSFIVMEKPTDAVVPETPEVTISGGDVENGESQTVTETSSTDIKTENTDSGEVLVITSTTTGSADSSVKIIISGGTPVKSGEEITGVTIPATATVTAEYPKTDAQGDTTTETPKVSFTLAVDIKNISKPLPVIDPAFKEDVVEDIGNKASKVLAMLSTVGDGNVNLKGTAPITITFEIPIDWVKSLGGKDRLAVFHVKDGDAKKQDIISIKESGAKYLITIKGSGFSSYALAVVEPQKSSGGAVDTGSGNYQYYPRDVPADGIVSFGTSKVVTGIELPAGSDGTVTLNIKPDFAMPENGFYAFEIDAPGYNLDAKINGGLSFQIPVADLEAAGWTAEDIVLFHGTVAEDGKIVWEALPTNLVKNENGVAYYKAAINSCSPFYIGFVKDGSVVNTEVVEPTVPETPETPVTPDEPEVLPPVDEPETPEQPTESPAPILAVLAGLGAAVILRRK